MCIIVIMKRLEYNPVGFGFYQENVVKCTNFIDNEI